MKKIATVENLTLLAALLGIGCGVWFKDLALDLRLFGDLFISLLKVLIVPLIAVSVFLAVAKLEGGGQLREMGFRTVVYFFCTSAMAAATGLILAGFLPKTEIPAGAAFDAAGAKTISVHDFLVGLVPANFFAALADGQILQIVVFVLLLGTAATLLGAERRKPLLDFTEAANDLLMVVIGWVLRLAPLGVFSLVALVTAQTDLSVFKQLGYFFALVAAGVLLHSLVTLPAVGYLVGRFNPWRHFLHVREALLVALTTASSSATLPVSMRTTEENAGVSKRAAGFVLPLGATLNMDGSALYQSLTVVFLATLAGIDMSLAQQMTVFLFIMASSAGTAGIPGGGIAMMGMALHAVGIPAELLGVYLLVDRFWDYPVTAVNVWGDLIGAKTLDRYFPREG